MLPHRERKPGGGEYENTPKGVFSFLTQRRFTFFFWSIAAFAARRFAVLCLGFFFFGLTPWLPAFHVIRCVLNK